MTDLSQTPTEVLIASRKRVMKMRREADRAGLAGTAQSFSRALAAINAELSRRQKDETQ